MAHAQEPVEDARELVAVQVPGLGDAERQLPVAVRAQREEQAVAGAVHRLQAEVVLLDLEPEHVLLVLLPVARRDPEVGVVELRRAHLLVAALAVLRAAQVLEDVPDRHPARLPERHARRQLGEVEEVEVLAEPAVVALLRLLDPLEVRVEILLVEERRAVDPRELLVLLVPAPIRTRQRRELHGLDRRGVLEVRALAEVGELALRVERDVALRPCPRARPCTARPRPRSGPSRRRGRSPRASTHAPRRSRGGPPPRAARGRRR